MSESKDSLQFSNKSCEQLEQKIEELEAANKGLQRLCDSRKILTEQKDATIQDLEQKLEALREECSKTKEHCSEQSPAKAMPSGAVDESPRTMRSVSFSGVLSYSSPQRAEVKELQDTVEELTLKLQNASYQKKKLEAELKEVLADNQVLGKTLEKTEAEVAELQAKVRLFEDIFEAQNLERSITSPRSRDLATSTPTADLLHSPGTEDSPALLPLKSPKVSLTMESLQGMSLFSEIDNQYSVVQKQYEDLLQRCTCSASLAHKNRYHVSAEKEDNMGGERKQDRPFKELFDEVFATLKQTTQVADRLIERRSHANKN